MHAMSRSRLPACDGGVSVCGKSKAQEAPRGIAGGQCCSMVGLKEQGAAFKVPLPGGCPYP